MNIFLSASPGRTRKVLPMSDRLWAHTCRQIHLHATTVWQATQYSWFLAVMNMGHLFLWMQRSKALHHVSLWLAIINRSVKSGIVWACPGIFTQRRERRTIIVSPRISS